MIAGHHVCLTSLPGYPNRAEASTEVGHLRPYRRKCRLTGEPNKCEKLLKNPVKDSSLGIYSTVLDRKVRPVLKMFDLIA